jgi:hypothetical protein
MIDARAPANVTNGGGSETLLKEQIKGCLANLLAATAHQIFIAHDIDRRLCQNIALPTFRIVRRRISGHLQLQGIHDPTSLPRVLQHLNPTAILPRQNPARKRETDKDQDFLNRVNGSPCGQMFSFASVSGGGSVNCCGVQPLAC